VFSLRGADQENYCGREEQSFLSGVPAGAEAEKRQQCFGTRKVAAGRSKWDTKKDETLGAAADVEEVVPVFSLQYGRGPRGV
jgi:hypothetical protein